jgi:hypothetical protein
MKQAKRQEQKSVNTNDNLAEQIVKRPFKLNDLSSKIANQSY